MVYQLSRGTLLFRVNWQDRVGVLSMPTSRGLGSAHEKLSSNF